MNENTCWLCLVIKALNQIFSKFRFLLFINSDQYFIAIGNSFEYATSL